MTHLVVGLLGIYCLKEQRLLNDSNFSSIVTYSPTDYKENMLAHRDNKHHSKWDLESTAVLLHNHFPTHAVIIVRPSKMALNTFSCYENFAEVNNFGAPTYALNIDTLKHLEMLLKNIELAVQQSFRTECDFNSMAMKQKFFDGPIDLIGFSKGCIVLNQILYSFSAVINESDQSLMPFIKKIKNIYWLEGGHSGPSSTWVTDKSVLKNFCNLKINIHIHVTPYQVLCDSKPRVAKEEKFFRETLQRMGANVRRKLHFEKEPRSLDVHFRVLEVFTESVD
ncbi:UPF0565 protein C2orf69 homolog [Stegodyphus dumicola]|uniref:UPF0565 protein C2orf69 homolog n=1 Tax=Stegodyphus dumicola TaxID=202533 RepID=UPI0015A9D699|nr:UPF0565 protein C2orf69 homolog [Stegodyphus dumicola]